MENPFDSGYYSEEDLVRFGFKSVGSNVRIAKNCTVIGLQNISIGDNVRIDGYSTLIASGGAISLGSYIHVGGYCLLSGGAGIYMEDFTGVSHGTKIYSKSDDYSGASLTNPMVPAKYLNILEGAVTLKRHVIVGSGSVILPTVVIGEGSSVGALSVVTKSLDDWGIYTGIPARRLKNRSRNLLELERDFLGK